MVSNCIHLDRVPCPRLKSCRLTSDPRPCDGLDHRLMSRVNPRRCGEGHSSRLSRSSSLEISYRTEPLKDSATLVRVGPGEQGRPGDAHYVGERQVQGRCSWGGSLRGELHRVVCRGGATDLWRCHLPQPVELQGLYFERAHWRMRPHHTVGCLWSLISIMVFPSPTHPFSNRITEAIV